MAGGCPVRVVQAGRHLHGILGNAKALDCPMLLPVVPSGLRVCSRLRTVAPPCSLELLRQIEAMLAEADLRLPGGRRHGLPQCLQLRHVKRAGGHHFFRCWTLSLAASAHHGASCSTTSLLTALCLCRRPPAAVVQD